MCYPDSPPSPCNSHKRELVTPSLFMASKKHKSSTVEEVNGITHHHYATFVDVIISDHCNQQFHCDANRLAESSEWFKALLLNHKQNSEDPKILELVEENTSIKYVLDYIYFDMISSFPDYKTRDSFINLAEKWQIDLDLFWDAFLNCINLLALAPLMKITESLNFKMVPKRVQLKIVVQVALCVDTQTSISKAALYEWIKRQSFPFANYFTLMHFYSRVHNIRYISFYEKLVQNNFDLDALWESS